MEHLCEACGSDPGAGAFCQHCGTRLSSARPTAAEGREDGAGRPGETSDDRAGAGAGIDPPAQQPTPPPEVVYVQAPAASAPTPSSGSGKGCATVAGATVLVVIAAIAVVVFLGWRWYQQNVAPAVEELGTAVEDGFGDLAESNDEVGPCYDLAFDDAGNVEAWSDVDCGGTRDAEVFHRWAFRDGSFPGSDALADEAFDTCTDWFEDYVGVPYIESTLRIDWLVPTEALWADGQREGICLVGEVRGPLTGPVEGTGR